MVYTNGPLTGQGGWTGGTSGTINTNTLRRNAGSFSNNAHVVGGEDLGLGFFIEYVVNYTADAGDAQQVSILLKQGATMIALLEINNQTGVTCTFEVDDTSGFLLIAGSPITTGPHLVALTVDAGGNCVVTVDGTPVLTGTLDFSATIPDSVEIHLNFEAPNAGSWLNNFSVGRA